MNVDTGYRVASRSDVEQVRRSCAWEEPLLPGADRSTDTARLHGSHIWTPPGTVPLVRHRAPDGQREITNARAPRAGWVVEFDLGVVHGHHLLGTRRLLESGETFSTTRSEADLPPDTRSLGYVEEIPLPMLVALCSVRVRATGQVTLATDDVDPLLAESDPVAHLGYIEAFPVSPRAVVDERAEPGVVVLNRLTDDAVWRHRYSIGPVDAGDASAGSIALGGLVKEPGRGLSEVWRLSDGTVRSGNTGPATAPRSGAEVARWIGAPIAWGGLVPKGWGVRAALARTARIPSMNRPAHGDPELLGYARTAPHRGWGPVYSSRHPVLADQYLTRSAIEATDLGYRVESIVAYTLDRHAARAPAEHAGEIKWASRFGQRRRFVEGWPAA